MLHPRGNERADSTTIYSQWKTLISAPSDVLRCFACLRAWRYVALRKKRRFTNLTRHESLAVEFVEGDLPLHALTVFAGDPVSEPVRFQWIEEMCLLLPSALEALDSKRRIPLHYALEKQWLDPDHVSWFVAQSQCMLMQPDSEGRTLLTHAVLHKCPEEILMLMAVEVARNTLDLVDEMLSGRHVESARRLCVRVIQEYFAGVPNFPHAASRELLLEKDALVMINGLLAMWRVFVVKWGYHGVPVLVEDLPMMRHVPVDSFLQLTIQAKGEPLRYQWYLDGEVVQDATQSTLFISQQVQAHNEGVYHCEISNWKGSAISSAMQLLVIDDQHGPDPSLRYLIDNSRDSLPAGVSIRRIRADLGGLVFSTVGDMSGFSLLLPPKCFTSLDGNGHDVSDTIGMDVVLREVSKRSSPKLRHGEQLVSRVVEILPSSIPDLDHPAILTIPHSWKVTDTMHKLVAIEMLPTAKPDEQYRDVDTIRIITNSSQDSAIAIEVPRFGRHAIITRAIESVNKENEACQQEFFVAVIHPKRKSIRFRHAKITFDIWLAYNRPDGLHAIESAIHEQQDYTSTLVRVHLRYNQIMRVRLGRKQVVTHQWRGFDALSTDLEATSSAALLKKVSIAPIDLRFDQSAGTPDDHGVPVYQVLDILIEVRKASIYQSAKKSGVDAVADGLLQLERTSQVLIPLVYDEQFVPERPTLYQRRPSQIALAYSGRSGTTQPGTHQHRHPSTLFQDLHEAEREFSPYFFTVELARFSETFWQRYDQTWWFDKTKSEILLGMYKVVHEGADGYVVIASDAHAGAIRIVRKSIDVIGTYSEPLLLEPPSATTMGLYGDTSDTDPGDDDDDTVNRLPSGLRRNIPIAASSDCSLEYRQSADRLKMVLEGVYSKFSHFESVFGVRCDADAVRAKLESHRDYIRAASLEIALLIFVSNRLEHQVRRIYLKGSFYSFMMLIFQLVERLLPELDCFPTDNQSITVELHSLFLSFLEVAIKLSSPGWLSNVLLDNWFDSDMNTILSRILRLMHNDAQHLTQVQDLTTTLEHMINGDGCPGLSMEDHKVLQLRDYMNLTLGHEQTAKDKISRSIADAMTHLLSKRMTADHEAFLEGITNELRSRDMGAAIETLRRRDTLDRHIRIVSPQHQERCARVPDAVRIRFGHHVYRVHTQHAIKVVNASINCGVQGQVDYRHRDKLLVFTPSIPFEKHTRYLVKVRAQEVVTAMGPLQQATTTYEFATSS